MYNDLIHATFLRMYTAPEERENFRYINDIKSLKMCITTITSYTQSQAYFKQVSGTVQYITYYSLANYVVDL